MMEIRKENFYLTDQKSKMDLQVIHEYLTNSYWAKGRDLETIKKSVENSYCVALFFNDQQIGFARVITDYSTFGYLCDVFVLPEFQGQGLGRWLVQNTLQSNKLKSVKKYMLATRDAHGLYAQFGFKELTNPDFYMELIK